MARRASRRSSRRARRKARRRTARKSRRSRGKSRRSRKSQKGAGCPLADVGAAPSVAPPAAAPQVGGKGKGKKQKGGKRKMNAFMVAKEKARKGGAASFQYKGKTYHKKKLKTGMVVYSSKK